MGRQRLATTGTLTTRQAAFCAAYIGPARFNATEAAIVAGYSARSAASIGSETLRKPEIAARVRAELAARCLSADEVLAELRDVATAEWRDFLTIKTDPRTGDTDDVRIDLSNKVKALELLGKAHGIFTDRVDISGTLTNRVELVGVSPDDI